MAQPEGISLLVAFVAGVLSFLSPCVLPVLPAYLGQLGVVVVRSPGEALPAGAGAWGAATGWRALPSAVAFVVGFGTIFTIAGLALSAAVDPFRADDAILRLVGGFLLVILGLNLMGVFRAIPLMRTWRPLERIRGSSDGTRHGRPGVAGGLLLGATFAIGWSPCIGPTLGAILGMSATYGPGLQVAALLVAYSLGLGLPFIAFAIAVDRAPAIARPLVRHGRTIELIGGGLVVAIGLAIMFDWLRLLSGAFSWLIPQV